MAPYGRPDDDLVPKGKPASQTRKNASRQPYPPAAPPPPWEPLYVDNEPRGRPRLPPHLIDASPIELFKLFWDTNTVADLVAHTNENARRRPQPQGRHARLWSPVTADEIYSYFSVVIHMGIYYESRVHNYWRKDNFFGV